MLLIYLRLSASNQRANCSFSEWRNRDRDSGNRRSINPTVSQSHWPPTSLLPFRNRQTEDIYSNLQLLMYDCTLSSYVIIQQYHVCVYIIIHQGINVMMWRSRHVYVCLIIKHLQNIILWIRKLHQMDELFKTVILLRVWIILYMPY